MVYDEIDKKTYCFVTQAGPPKPNDPDSLPFFGTLTFIEDKAMFAPMGDKYKVAFGSKVNSIYLADQKVIILSVHTEK